MNTIVQSNTTPLLIKEVLRNDHKVVPTLHCCSFRTMRSITFFILAPVITLSVSVWLILHTHLIDLRVHLPWPCKTNEAISAQIKH